MEGVQTALNLLELPSDFTIEQLRIQYKKMVVKHHPDRSADPRTAPMFQLLTSCYRLLVEHHAVRQNGKEFNELKAAAMHHHQNQNQNNTTASKTNIHMHHDPNKKFDVGRFNEVFSEHRFKDKAVDGGYDKWMGDPASFKQQDVRKQLVKYREPQPIEGASGLNFYQLGVDRVDDYSAENIRNQDLSYMDYRIAYTAQSILEDEKKAKKNMRKEYKSVEDLERDRSSMPIKMSVSEQIEYDKRVKMTEALEKKRLKKLTKYDQRINDFYEKNHALFLQ